MVAALSGSDAIGDDQLSKISPAETEILRYTTPPRDIALTASTGIMAYPYEAGGFLLRLDALHRSGLIGIGGYAEIGGLFMTMLSCGGTAGMALRTNCGFRTELLGTFGIHHFEGWKTQMLSNDPGACATLPFIGSYLCMEYIFNHNRGRHFTLGCILSVDQDLEKARKSYTYWSTDWFNGSANYQQVTHSVGGTRFAFGITLGMTIDR